MHFPADIGKKLCLLGATLTMFIALLEFVVAPIVLPILPLNLQGALPHAFGVLAQSSKSGVVPKDYIAIVGDSYAEGLGDWLRNVDPSRNPPYHSAHIIAAQTGRDVVNFGDGGASSLRALIREPFTILDYLARTWLYAFEDPELIVHYFYEGNDLTDNIRDLVRNYRPRDELERIRKPGAFDLYVTEQVIGASKSDVTSRNSTCSTISS